jgi:hypothetical protein
MLTSPRRLATLTNTAVKSKQWQGDDGVITEGVSLTSNNDSVGFKCEHRPHSFPNFKHSNNLIQPPIFAH